MKVTFVLLAAVAAAYAQDTTAPAETQCEPHDDHWHCPDGVPEPTTPPPAMEATATEEHDHGVTATASCEPHDDHWHCPDGVPEPTTPPPALSATTPAASATPTSEEPSTMTSVPSAAPTSEEDHDHDHEATATTCEPHGDHWHCPSGVPEPTTLPAEETTPTASGAESTEASPAPSEFTGAAVVGAKSGSLAAVVLGAIGVFFV